jgi:hypothetical protein
MNKKNSKKTMIFIIIIIFIAICILLFIKKLYFTSNEELLNKQTDQLINESNETDNWQTYENNKYGYEVKYPENWFVFWSQHTPGGPIYYQEDVDQQERIILAPEYPDKYNFLNDNRIRIDRQNGEFFIKDSNIVDDYWDKLGKVNKRTGEVTNKFINKETINNIDFIIFEQHGDSQALFMYKGEFFWVRGEKIETNLFNKIIHTFEFIN